MRVHLMDRSARGPFYTRKANPESMFSQAERVRDGELIPQAVKRFLLEIFWCEECLVKDFRFIRRHRIEIREPKPLRRHS